METVYYTGETEESVKQKNKEEKQRNNRRGEEIVKREKP